MQAKHPSSSSTQLGEAARKNLSHVSSADDADSHMDSLQ
jgi:hypothetical protein